MPASCEPGGSTICCPGDGGTFLPLFGDWEQRSSKPLRFVIYLLVLGWFFMGVAIISDVFMGAIERMTSKKYRKWNAKLEKYITVMVWNETVANLTLMALGSSAPEIMLSVIELLLAPSYFAGELGPSTIVGSAAFNLLMIISVCVSAVPSGEVRRIKEFAVYLVTVFFSLFAYIWLIIILNIATPNVVTILEGVLTFVFFPILVTIAWMTDRGYFQCSSDEEAPDMGRGRLLSTKEDLAELQFSIRREFGSQMSDEDVMAIIQRQYVPRASRATYRSMAIRTFSSSKKVYSPSAPRCSQMSNFSSLGKVTPWDEEEEKAKQQDMHERPIVEFYAERKAVLENAGKVTVQVVRRNCVDQPVKVRYATEEGTAKNQTDFEHVEGVLEFGAGELHAEIQISIVDDVAYEEDEEFYVQLFICVDDELSQSVYLPEHKSRMTIIIIDDDLPGTLSFARDEVKIAQGDEDFELEILVERKKGSTGTVTCTYETEEDTAMAGKDFVPAKGTLTFEPAILEQTIKVTIKARSRYESEELFRVVLKDPSDGAKFDATTDGLAESCICTVLIQPNLQHRTSVDKLMVALNVNMDKAKIGYDNWADQFRSAWKINGGEDEEEEEATLAFIFHDLDVTFSQEFAFKEEFKNQLVSAVGSSVDVSELQIMYHEKTKNQPVRMEVTALPAILEELQANAQDKLAVMEVKASVEMVDPPGPSIGDWFMHIITVPWKLLFACVPPVDYCDGWITFVCSLLFIGLVTAYIGELAALVGCVADLPDMVTAITVVALGTSLPDTFASKTAAVQDEHADASIVNVTGSNSVNVFLGLGLPWMVGAIRWAVGGSNAEWREKYATKDYILDHLGAAGVANNEAVLVVEAGSLVFSVTVFTSCAICCLLVLAARRCFVGGELGGPRPIKVLTTILLVMLWLTYICLSAWYVTVEG